jgi:hypothetical protein
MEPAKITFGMIVLNGEPFISYSLRSLYPFAHEIIVVEGASPFAAAVASHDGHSVDGTLEAIRRFMEFEDPEAKVRLITAEDDGHPNGFWPGEKHEQSRAYARRATGNWLWQVDVDEFYHARDMAWICENVLTNQDVSAVSFKQVQFWGGLESTVDGWYLRHYEGEVFHRVFKWAPGYSYLTHRPPTVVNAEGVDLRTTGWITPQTLAAKGIFLYHYSLVLPRQVSEKSTYYSQVDWAPLSEMDAWASENYAQLRNPYRVHNVYRYPSWLEAFRGSHPAQIDALWADIAAGRVPATLRRTDDIDRVLRNRRYMLGKSALKVLGPVVCGSHLFAWKLFRKLPTRMRDAIKGMWRGNRARVAARAHSHRTHLLTDTPPE